MKSCNQRIFTAVQQPLGFGYRVRFVSQRFRPQLLNGYDDAIYLELWKGRYFRWQRLLIWMRNHIGWRLGDVTISLAKRAIYVFIVNFRQS